MFFLLLPTCNLCTKLKMFSTFNNFRFSHLQHTPFIYTIKVMNNKTMQTRGTVRIFLAPKFDEQGKEFKFSEMRLLMMEMDRFEVNCE